MSAIAYPRSVPNIAAPPSAAKSWIRFITQSALALFAVAALLVGLTLAFGALLRPKTQLLTPVWNRADKTYQFEFTEIERGITIIRNVGQKTVVNPLVWSPDGSQIAFEVTANNDTEIDVMSVESGQIRQITNGGAAQSPLAWSPDSRRIAFVSANWREIQVADVQQKTTTPLATMLNAVQLPLWSPDGSQLAFVSRNDLGQSALELVNNDGGNLRDIGKSFDIAEDLSLYWSPDWSPDGKYIILAPLINGAINIYRLDVTTGDLIALTNSAAAKGNPVWSPDGSQIAFWEMDNKAVGVFINRMNADGSNLAQLTYIPNKDNTELFWSDDGQQVGIETNILNKSAFYLMNADGSNLQHLFDVNTSASNPPIWRP